MASFARELYHCSSCNYCVDAVWPARGMSGVCATMEQHSRAPGYSGRGYIEAARTIVEGQALNAEALAQRVFTCTTCGNCETACPIGLHPASVGRALREELIAADCLPPALAQVRDVFFEQGNPYGVPRTQRHDWCAQFPAAASERGPLLFAGCAAALGLPAEARAACGLLSDAGFDVGIATTACCGAPLAELGLRREADALASAAAAALAGREVLVTGSECRKQLQAAGVEARSVAAWLCAAVAGGALALQRRSAVQAPSAVRLIESCQHKFSAADGDEHAVAALFGALGLTLSNATFPNPYASCCGAAGGMPVIEPLSAARMARARLPASGVAVTLDPRCACHLNANAGDGIEVLGFASFVARYFTLHQQLPS